MIDLVIAGGGPAGLATAIFASKAGMSVVVIEPHVGPIDKACGEGIMPAGRKLLDRMGLSIEGGKPFSGIRYHRKGRIAAGRFSHGKGIGLRRTVLSAALWERAGDLGVERVHGRFRTAEFSNTSVSILGIGARWLVGADGLNSIVRKSVGIPLEKARPGRYGVRRHFAVERWDDFVDVFLGEAEEAYVTPVGDHTVGVAILSQTAKPFDEGLAEFPELIKMLGDPVGKVQGAGPFGRFAAQASVGRTALVGDAAGFLDPITGEGIRLAFESADLLVQCLVQDRLQDYDAGWRRIVRRYRTITSGVLALRRNPYLKESMVPVLRGVPRLFDGMLGLLGGR